VTVAASATASPSGWATADPTKESYPAVLVPCPAPSPSLQRGTATAAPHIDYESTGFFPAYVTTQEYKDSLNTKAEVVVIMLGTNDAVWSPNQTDFAEDFTQLLDTYINLPHKPHVIVMLPPHLLGLKGYDDKLEKVVEQEKAVIAEKRLDMIDAYAFSADMAKYSKDGVHFTFEGYRLLAEFVYALSGNVQNKPEDCKSLRWIIGGDRVII
jgi:hypothetical protein